MTNDKREIHDSEYIKKRKKLSGFFFETALPNEYLVQIGKKDVKPILGGRKLKLFRKFIRIPASVQTLYFVTDNANKDYQGIGVEGYASWRIDPQNPKQSITVLDFFDSDDPMQRTNQKLKTICTEAVRHVLSNMSIDDALKKKDDIAMNLKEQLGEIEKRWGIIFDQVGIEKVTIMSNTLFEELQAQFRDNLRLDVARTKINTDREIAKEENNMREKIDLEKQQTDKKIHLSKIDNDTRVKEAQLAEQQNISKREQEVEAEEFRLKTEFQMEKEQKEFELSALSKNLDIKMQETIKKYLETQKEIETINNDIDAARLIIEKKQKETQQYYTKEALTNSLIENLAEIIASLHIDNYTVLDSGKDGNMSPLSKIVAEIISILKGTDISSIINQSEEQ